MGYCWGYFMPLKDVAPRQPKEIALGAGSVAVNQTAALLAESFSALLVYGGDKFHDCYPHAYPFKRGWWIRRDPNR